MITLLLIIITLLLIIYLLKQRSEPFIEGLTNDEAIQNVASLYNTQDMKVSKIDVTDTATANNLNVTTAANIPKLQLGSKWVLTGSGKDTQGEDDEWLRFVNAKGDYGGIGVGKVFDKSAGGQLSTVIANLQTSLQGQINDLKGRFDPIFIDTPWDRNAMVAAAAPYFDGKPEGWTKRFMFVANRNTDNVGLWHGIATKVGNQMVMWQFGPDQNNVGGIFRGGNSNDTTWRRNVS